MLKVVGASWYQTRISTCILIASGLLVIAAFFIAGMERPKYNGTYCATAYWSSNAGFKIEYWKQSNDLENIPKGVARISYRDSTQENGWSQVEIETQRTYPDWVQAFAAGLLEGSLTWNSIYYQWINTISSACNRDENSQKFCTWLRDLLSSNYVKIKEQLKFNSFKHDHYWYQIQLLYYQLEGLEHGWRNGAQRAYSDLENEIPSEDFLLLNSAADLDDLKIYFENFVMYQNETNQKDEILHNQTQKQNDNKYFSLPSSTMLLKFIRNNNANDSDDFVTVNDEIKINQFSKEEKRNSWKLFFGHSSVGNYSSMLHVQKRYKLHYHFSSDQKSNTVPGVDIAFTGYPGVLASTDDFYIIRGRHVHSLVGGISIKNKNLNLWKSVDLNSMIPLSARVIASNRLSQNRQTWIKLMSRYSITGNKQWILIDLKKLDNLNLKLNYKNQNKHNLTQSTELKTTEILKSNLTFINNFDIFHISDDNEKTLNKDIVWIIEQLPGQLFSKDITENIINKDTITWFSNGIPYTDDCLNYSKILLNDHLSDSLLNINITNLNDIEIFLRKNAFRGDLLGEESIPYGNIDLKLFSHETQIDDRYGNSYFHAISGPLYVKSYTYNERELKKNIEPTKNETTAVEEYDEPPKSAGRRSIRNDIRVLAMRKYHGPFKWSQVNNNFGYAKHLGHPDKWDFDKITPKWAWHEKM